MCGLCGVLGTEAHWTDAAGPDSRSGAPPGGRTRRQERLHRVGLANKVLKHYGLTLADWEGNCFWTIADRPVAERMTGRRCDPLDPQLIAGFDRLAIETTGLADPAPIIFTLLAEPVLRHHFRVGHVVTTVDAVNGARHLAQHPESVKQVAVADRVVLTKTDLAGPAQAEALRTACRRVNPAAPIFEPAVDPIGPDQLFAGDPADPSGTRQDARRWLGPVAAATPPETGVGQASAHDRDVYAFSVTVDRALDWTAFGIWLTMLLHAHGEDILRVKGLLQVVGVPTPVVIHGVQHLVHPPVHLDGWPTAG